MTETIIAGICGALVVFLLFPRMGIGSTMLGKGLFKEIDLKGMSWFYVEVIRNCKDGTKITLPAFLCQFIEDILGLILIILVLVLGLRTTDARRIVLICCIYCGIGLFITFSFILYIYIVGGGREKKWLEEQNKEENKKNRFL